MDYVGNGESADVCRLGSEPDQDPLVFGRNFGADGIALTDDGAQALVFLERRAELERVSDGTTVERYELPGLITAAAFFPGGILFGLQTGALVVHRHGKPRVTVPSDGGAIRRIVRGPVPGTVATLSADGAVRMWSTQPPRLLAAFAEFDDGEYLTFTPGGAYRGTREAAHRVGWVFDGPTEAFRFEQFAARFDKPGIVQARLKGEDVAASPLVTRPPRVRLTTGVPPTVDGATLAVGLQVSAPVRVDTLAVFVEGQPKKTVPICEQQADINVEIPLLHGQNAISVTAFDHRGASSNPTAFKVFSTAKAPRGDLWVVAVGVDDYPGLPESLQLGLAVADARGVAHAFSKLAGKDKPYARAHVRVLTNAAASVRSIKSALSELSKMKPHDVAVVFLGGHGFKQSGGSEMVFATGGVRVEPKRRGAARFDGRSLREHGIGWTEVGGLLSKAKGRLLVLLDACHSGDMSRELVVPNNDLAHSLVSTERAGAVVFAASKGRQVSYEPSGTRGLSLEATKRPLVGKGDHGFFTGAVLAALGDAGTDLDGDGAIQLSELVDEVTRRVSKATDGKQTPWVARREMFGDFTLATAR